MKEEKKSTQNLDAGCDGENSFFILGKWFPSFAEWDLAHQLGRSQNK
jgi:hypothetical protein